MTDQDSATGSPSEESFVLLNDEPVSNADQDLMNTANTVERLVELVIGSRNSTPFTLSIDAGWGMGKSSLMRQLQRALDETPNTHTIWFNAWTSGTNALEVLIKSVFMRFDRNILRRAYNRVAANNRALGVLRASLMLVMSTFGLRHIVNDLWQRLSIDAPARHDIHRVVGDMAQEWANAPKMTTRQIVVFVDDLDRCSHEIVLGICESIKLYLDVPGMVFVIGCDQSALNYNLQHATNTSDQASQYLEKIIQVNYQSPLPNQQQVRNFIDGCAAQSRTHLLFSEQLSEFVAERTGRNPRRIKRLINSFVLEYHLDREWEHFGADTLVRILLLQQFYPQFYKLLANPQRADPIRVYFDFRDVRAHVKRGDPKAHFWKYIFAAHGLEPISPGSTREELLESLSELEKEIPEVVLSLVADENFAAILTNLHESTDIEPLRRHLQRRKDRFDHIDDYVLVPTKEMSMEKPRAEVRTTEEGKLTLVSFTSLKRLAEGCGSEQAWIKVPEAEVRRLAEEIGADILQDVPLPEEQRKNVQE